MIDEATIHKAIRIASQVIREELERSAQRTVIHSGPVQDVEG
jgi:hypothetical protein